MKLTIGIPVFDQQEYLADAIESALNQTIPCEIIVCNDGSKDHSLDVAKSYVAKSYPIKVIDQLNKGLPSARNTLIMNMTGDYFLPLDADDELFDNAAEKILEIAEQTNADIIAPSFKQFGVSNEIVTLMENPTLEDFLSANRIGYFSAVKKEALLEVGGYSPRMVWGWEDWHLWINLLTRGKILKTIPDILVLYRTKQESMYTRSLAHGYQLGSQMRYDYPNLLWPPLK